MKFLAEPDELIITLEGAEVFFGLKRQLNIPLLSIVNLDWQMDFALTEPVWRVIGTDIPGVLAAGNFRGGGRRYFLYLRQPRGLTWTGGPTKAQNTLVITTRDYQYARILLSCQPDIGAQLVQWWRGGGKTPQPAE